MKPTPSCDLLNVWPSGGPEFYHSVPQADVTVASFVSWEDNQETRYRWDSCPLWFSSLSVWFALVCTRARLFFGSSIFKILSRYYNYSVSKSSTVWSPIDIFQHVGCLQAWCWCFANRIQSLCEAGFSLPLSQCLFLIGRNGFSVKVCTMSAQLTKWCPLSATKHSRKPGLVRHTKIAKITVWRFSVYSQQFSFALCGDKWMDSWPSGIKSM